MAIDSGHAGPAGSSNQWLLTRSSADEHRLPGKLVLPEGREWLNIARLVLLIPDIPLDIERVVSLFGALNLPRKTQVILAELASTSKNNGQRKRLHTIALRIQQFYPQARCARLYEPDWPSALRAFTTRHDLLIVTSGNQMENNAFSHVLVDALDLPILEVSGVYLSWYALLLGRINQLIFNLFPFLAVAAFLWVQTQITSQSHGWVSSFEIGTTVVIEFVLIFIWSLFLD